MKKWKLSLVQPLILLVLSPASCENSGPDSKCDFGKCSRRHLSNGRKRDNCRALFNYASCMTKYEKLCRGNMLYHSNINGVKLKLKSSKCHEKKSRKKSRSKKHHSRTAEKENNLESISYSDTWSDTSSSSSSSAANSAYAPSILEIVGGGVATSNAGGGGGIQADEPYEMENSKCSYSDIYMADKRKLCAVLGSGDYFRIKNWDGSPHTNCPMQDATQALALIDTPYISIMGTIDNRRLTKITVIIRASGECAELKYWSGEVYGISPYFTDGSNSTGFNNSATVKSIGAQAIQIHLHYLNTKITIRQVIGFDWLQLSALMPGSLASADSDISSHVSLCSSACSALQVQKKVPSSSGSVSDDSPCDSFWCRNSPSPWGALAASDAASLDPADWNQFRSSSTHPVLTSGLSNCILLFLFYLTVL